MRIDVNAFMGRYPFRHVPGGAPAAIRDAMGRVDVDQCWLSHLSAVFWRDPMEGNAALYEVVAAERAFRPIPAIHPGLDGWEDELEEAVARRAPAVRSDAVFYGLPLDGPEMGALLAGAATRGLPVLMAVRLEDVRQRHPHDGFPGLEPWMVRRLLRAVPEGRLLITHADREFVEQVHYGSTAAEASRILWDVTGIWGPPEDHLAHLVATVGPGRFCFGTGMPLRIPEASVARLDLTPLDPATRTAIESGNARAFARAG